jgi:hypothetical protein
MGTDVSSAERLRRYREAKKNKRREQNRKDYQTHVQELRAKGKQQRHVHISERIVSTNAIYRRELRAEIKQQKDRQKLYNQKSRAKIKDVENRQDDKVFNNRMSRCRAVNKLKEALPTTPRRRSAVVTYYMSSNSPTARHVQKTSPISEKILKNIKTFISETKLKRNTDARNVMNILSASVSAEKCHTGEQKKVARKLGMNQRRLSGGKRIRTAILKSEKSCYEFTKRKTRADATSGEVKKLAYDFWLSPAISRTTGNKKDIKRERTAPKQYVSHQIQILEKTQTEVFLDFKAKYPDIKISQRLFESYRPFYVIAVRPKDRNTCCCRQHIEARLLFKKCMEFRKRLHEHKTNVDKDTFPVYDHLSDICQKTVCGSTNSKIQCLNRNCADCGVSNIPFHSDELDSSDTAEDVHWEKFEYVKVQLKGGKIKTKLMLTKKTTKPGPMFDHFKTLLESFPAHQYRANWQSEQYKNLINSLPMDHAVCVHDYSENYRCSERNEIQSAYFQRTEVSIHVSILHRHAVLEVDGVESMPEAPVIISEHVFVIAPDLQHDRHFTSYCQKNISEYLQSISAGVKTMHEFTDGCTSQYKSRNCMGDVSMSADLGYDVLIRNYYETAHAKGPQDAAGGFLKNQADLAVLRGRATIQSARDLYDFAEETLQTPQSGMCKRRVFRYVEEIPRVHDRSFNAVHQNRKVHQVIATNFTGDVMLRELSCYICEECVKGDVRKCKRVEFAGSSRSIKMEVSNAATDDNEVDDSTITNMDSALTHNTVVAVIAEDPDYEFYLLKILDEPEIVDTEIADEWGCTFAPGSRIVRGHYFDRSKNNPFVYKLLPNQLAIWHVAAVRYMCVEFGSRNKITIPEELHLDIIQSLV